MSQNTYSQPKLFIEDKEIKEYTSITLNEPGTNRINSLSISIGDPDYQDAHLFNAKVKFYLNEGNAEGTPTFIGYIREIAPSDTGISITAYDARIFMAGTESRPIALTDKNNYDGYTAIQFLGEVIRRYVNKDKPIIDTSALSDTDPAIPMRGIRTAAEAPYDIFLAVIEQAVDDSTPEDPLSYVVTMEGERIIVEKKKSKDSNKAYTLSYMDGISSLSYTKTLPPTSCIATGDGGSWGEFVYGNTPTGHIGSTIKSTGEANNAVLSNLARIEVMKNYVESREISVVCSRAFDVGLETLVYLSVPESELRGNHRVISKRIQIRKNAIGCTLGLDKRPSTVGDYLDRKIKVI